MQFRKFKYATYLLFCWESCKSEFVRVPVLRAQGHVSVLQTGSTPVYDIACFLHPIISNESLFTMLEERLNYLFILLEKITVQNYCPLER